MHFRRKKAHGYNRLQDFKALQVAKILWNVTRKKISTQVPESETQI